MSSIMWPASCDQYHVAMHHVYSIMWSHIMCPASCGQHHVVTHHVSSIVCPASCPVQSMQRSTRKAQPEFLPVLHGGPAWAVSQSDVCPSTFNLTLSHLRELSRKCELTLLVVPWYRICCQAVAYPHLPHSRSSSTFCCFPWQEGKCSISGPWCL